MLLLERHTTHNSAHLYGAAASNFRDKAVSEFQTTWNKCVRRIFNLPYTTHTRFLPHILEIGTVTDQICGCFLKMVKTMEQSNNMRVQYITKLSISSAKFIIGSYMRIICRRLKLDNISQLMNMGSCVRKKTYIQECTVEDHIALNLIQNLRGFMSSTYFINGFGLCEIDDTLEYLCIM